MITITVARKPLEGTVANNVLKHGTGGLNIDATRIGTEARFNPAASNPTDRATVAFGAIPNRQGYEGATVNGRWPANLILSSDVAAEVDAHAPGGHGRGKPLFQGH